MDKRYTLGIQNGEHTTVAKNLNEAVQNVFRAKFGGIRPNLKLEPWDAIPGSEDGPRSYTMSDDGNRIGIVHVVNVEE